MISYLSWHLFSSTHMVYSSANTCIFIVSQGRKGRKAETYQKYARKLYINVSIWSRANGGMRGVVEAMRKSSKWAERARREEESTHVPIANTMTSALMFHQKAETVDYGQLIAKFLRRDERKVRTVDIDQLFKHTDNRYIRMQTKRITTATSLTGLSICILHQTTCERKRDKTNSFSLSQESDEEARPRCVSHQTVQQQEADGQTKGNKQANDI